MNVIEEALLVTNPKEDYYITKPTGFTNYLSAITEKLENIQKKKYNIERTIWNTIDSRRKNNIRAYIIIQIRK